jgi:chorismate mutase/prephenate dehydrogenase
MTDQTQPHARPLPYLRALIDSLDHELLQLLVQRVSLVREVAQYKREHSVAIRDAQRERFIIDDRQAYAQALGLSPALVEGLFRMLMWDSRDRQAALRAELPLDHEPKAIGIIGGSGGMGRCMARLFSDLGHHVMLADLDTETTPEETARIADVVVISVPIDVTLDVIRQLGPLVRPDALLLDITSIKQAPLEAMLESTQASVVGTHPMFGPSVHSLQGQRIVLCPGRGEEWINWARQMFRARGLTIKEADPADHDRAMAIVPGAAPLLDRSHRIDAYQARRDPRRNAKLHLTGLPHGTAHDGPPLRPGAGTVRRDRDEQPPDGRGYRRICRRRGVTP